MEGNENLAEKIQKVIETTADELVSNLQAIKDISADLRLKYYENRNSLSCDEKRRIGTFLKLGTDTMTKAFMEALMRYQSSKQNVVSSSDISHVVLPATKFDNIIKDMGPYARERARMKLTEKSAQVG